MIKKGLADKKIQDTRDHIKENDIQFNKYREVVEAKIFEKGDVNADRPEDNRGAIITNDKEGKIINYQSARYGESYLCKDVNGRLFFMSKETFEERFEEIPSMTQPYTT